MRFQDTFSVPSLGLGSTDARPGGLWPHTQAKGRKPQQQPGTNSAYPGPILLPVPEAGSAQQRRGQGE